MEIMKQERWRKAYRETSKKILRETVYDCIKDPSITLPKVMRPISKDHLDKPSEVDDCVLPFVRETEYTYFVLCGGCLSYEDYIALIKNEKKQSFTYKSPFGWNVSIKKLVKPTEEMDLIPIVVKIGKITADFVSIDSEDLINVGLEI